MPKKSLRRAMLDRRSALSFDEWALMSGVIQRNFLDSELFLGATVIALYVPVKREVDTSIVRREALTAGKTLLLPVIMGEIGRAHV